MGEQDGAGFPLSYLLLSTATSIDQGKRRRALTAWAKCVRDTYGLIVKFTHVDKDMAEIGMLKDVWNAKISLCWWHLRRAVRTRLASTKLATTPYDSGRAHAEFDFIDVAFVPAGQADGAEYEGGMPDSVTPVISASQQPRTMTMANGLRITLPARQPLSSAPKNAGAPPPMVIETGGDLHMLRESLAASSSGNVVETAAAACTQRPAPSTTAKEKENLPLEGAGGVQTRFGRTTKPTARSDAADAESLAHALNARTKAAAVPRATKPRKATVTDEAASASSEDEGGVEETKTRRTFCPAAFREPIVTMMEKHYCAHPLLPGYAHPSPEGIKRWAVTQMYKFCVKHGLPEVWAYLWENWYRSSRWELWARCVHPEIPVLKTTMILESQ